MANKNFTEVIKLTPAGTEVVRGAPVKITRARSGSLGKDTEEEFVEKPNEDWFDVDLLNHSPGPQGRQTGYGRWAERIGTRLNQIDQTEDVSQLPEMLANEEVTVQAAAERRLGELERAVITGFAQAASRTLRQVQPTRESERVAALCIGEFDGSNFACTNACSCKTECERQTPESIKASNKASKEVEVPDIEEAAWTDVIELTDIVQEPVDGITKTEPDEQSNPPSSRFDIIDIPEEAKE